MLKKFKKFIETTKSDIIKEKIQNIPLILHKECGLDLTKLGDDDYVIEKTIEYLKR